MARLKVRRGNLRLNGTSGVLNGITDLSAWKRDNLIEEKKDLVFGRADSFGSGAVAGALQTAGFQNHILKPDMRRQWR